MSGEKPPQVLLCHTQSNTAAQGLHVIPALCCAMCSPGDLSAWTAGAPASCCAMCTPG